MNAAFENSIRHGLHEGGKVGGVEIIFFHSIIAVHGLIIDLRKILQSIRILLQAESQSIPQTTTYLLARGPGKFFLNRVVIVA